ncbi:MAG TPA: fibronectin type III domain-containing protein [Acetobacteraceae bacterium]|nr:fibronectin type III domain-containing protein [Acetobacteraceae bacterium]
MPTISQLPSVSEVTAADAIPVSQNGVTHSVSVGSLLASMQPAIISDSGTLLGRSSLGSGGPESVTVGSGLLLNAGTLTASPFDLAEVPQQSTLTATDHALLDSNGVLALLPVSSLRGLFSAGTNISIDANGTISAAGGVTSSYSITSLAPVTTIASGDLVAISQGGTDHTISYANLLDGQTIDAATAAAPASDTDVFWVGQGSSTMLAQTFGAVWTWIKTKLPTYRRPVVEIVANTTLDGTIHNGAILVCSQPITLTPAFVNMSSGFTCSVVNVSGGNVTFAAGIVTSSGSQTLGNGQAAELRAFTYTGGDVVFAAIAGAVGLQAPGQVTGLAVGVTTPASVALAWQVPATGGTPTGYTVNYRVTLVGGAWTSQSAAGSSLTVAGLGAATQYDFEVIANNAAGSGAASSVATGTTQAAPAQVPGQVTGLTAGGPTASTVNLSWTAPSTGGAVASYTAQYRVTGGTGWNTAASGITGTSYTVTGLAATTSYDFQVFAVNAAGTGTAPSVASATTTIPAPGLPSGLAVGTATATTMPLSWTAPASGGAVASYSVRSSPHGVGTWTTVPGIGGTSTTIIGLTAGTSYDFEVDAANAGGDSGWTGAITASTVVAAPGLPTGLAAGAATATTMPLSWTAPASGGAVASYSVRSSPHGVGTWTTVIGVSGTSTTITSLTANTSYDFEVDAVNAGGDSGWTAAITASTMVAAPGLPTGLAAGTATATTMPLSWTAPASGGAVASYSVGSSPHDAGTWTMVTGVSGTSTTITGLTVSTSYDFEVEAVNAGGNSGWTAAITATTTSGGSGNYLLTAGMNPSAGSTWAHGTSGIAVNVNDNSVAADGSHTLPTSVMFGWSVSNSVMPTSGLTAAVGTSQSISGMSGHNLWYQWISAPAAAGAYYFWAIAKNSGGAAVATYVSPSTFAIT